MPISTGLIPRMLRFHLPLLMFNAAFVTLVLFVFFCVQVPIPCIYLVEEHVTSVFVGQVVTQNSLIIQAMATHGLPPLPPGWTEHVGMVVGFHFATGIHTRIRSRWSAILLPRC